MKSTLLFLGETVRQWRTTGAIAPSGPFLARAIADLAGDIPDGQVIVELGPGTGVITRELVARFPKARIVAVEVIESFADRLAVAFPTVTVVRGCASKIDAHLADLGIAPESVAAVVSGLPLLVLPDDLPQKVLKVVGDVLRPGRRFVQFTYSEKKWRRFTLPGFERIGRRRVWRNIPPAVAFGFARTGVVELTTTPLPAPATAAVTGTPA